MGNETKGAAPAPAAGGKSSTGLDENIAGLLCYVAGWVTGIIFLVIEKDSKTVKFHAWQSIFTFGGLTIISIALGFIPNYPVFFICGFHCRPDPMGIAYV
jgi:hypothetical protein